MPHDPTLPIRPLTARSAILSMLLGAHPPSAPASELVEWGGKTGIAESTVRAALSRMVKGGDLVKRGTQYTLSESLLERQRRADRAMLVPLKPWNGDWLIVLVVAVGNDAATRLHLRRSMIADHFAEVREGAWVRPDNLEWRLSPEIEPQVERMVGAPLGVPVPFARRVFELDRHAAEGRQLLSYVGRAKDPGDRLSTVAAIVRYLIRDPLLPDELLPRRWPTRELRKVHGRFSDDLMHERTQLGSPPSAAG